MNSTSAERLLPVSVKDYLEGEQAAQRKHEFFNGMIYAMVGGKHAHNLIASNILGILYSQLQDSPCQALNSDSKIRIEIDAGTRFYYPDVSVICEKDIREGVYQDRPTFIVEVLSNSTRRIDEGEKQQAYLTIESLSAYLLVEQEMAAAKLFRRDKNGFQLEIIEGLSATIALPTISASLAMSKVYANVKFRAETSD